MDGSLDKIFFRTKEKYFGVPLPRAQPRGVKGAESPPPALNQVKS